MKRLILAGLLACTACAPQALPPLERPPVAVAAPAPRESGWVDAIATALQLNPAADPKTRADPYPCARAAYAAQQGHTPLPRCYYQPMGASSVPVGWLP